MVQKIVQSIFILRRAWRYGYGTLITFHHGRKTKSESFASFRGRVNISGGSKIAWINVECTEDSLSVAVPSKVKKVFAGLRDSCHSSVTNSLLGGNWRDSEGIENSALLKNLFIWQQSHSQPMAVWIISNSRNVLQTQTYYKETATF